MNTRLTNILRKRIVDNTMNATVIPHLYEIYDKVCHGITRLAKIQYADFDFRGAEAFKRYINWHERISISFNDRNFYIQWSDDFLREYSLENISTIPLINYKIPHSSQCTPELEHKYITSAKEVCKHYIFEFRKGKQHWQGLKTALQGMKTFSDVQKYLPELASCLPKAEEKQTTEIVPMEQYEKLRRYFSSAFLGGTTNEDS